MWTTTKTVFPYDMFRDFDSVFEKHKFVKNKHEFSYSSEMKENSCFLKVEVPGIDPKNISVTFSGQLLIITCPSHDKKGSWKIDKQYDIEKCVASYSFGVLTVRIPEKVSSETKSGTIEISVE